MSYVLVSTIGVFVAVVGLMCVAFKGLIKATAKYDKEVISNAKRNLDELFFFVDSKKLLSLILALGSFVGILVWYLLSSVLLAIFISGLIFLAPKYVVRWTKIRRLKQLTEQLPDVLVMIAGSLRAGCSLNNALANIAAEARPPISQEFALLVRQQRLGMSMDSALANMEKRIPSNDFVLVFSAIRIAKEVGGNLAETLDRLADTLRRKTAMEGKIQSLTTQGKLQGIVISFLPLALAMVLFWMDGERMRLLFTTPVGGMVCAVVILLEILGAILIRKVVTIDV